MAALAGIRPLQRTIDTRMSTSGGSLLSPVSASPEKGLLLTDWLVERLIGILDEEFPNPVSTAGDRNGERERTRA